MDRAQSKKPFKSLGEQLRKMRERVRETLAEVSGAVEVDVIDLARFEQGKQRPAEEILLLLISHFGARDDEATKLWDLAGYNLDKIPGAQMANDNEGSAKQNIMVAGDTRVMYTDTVHVMVNNYGVIMNFMQAGTDGQPQNVSRVGMSKEHARSVLEVLKETLRQADQQAGSQTQGLLAPRRQSSSDEKPKS